LATPQRRKRRPAGRARGEHEPAPVADAPAPAQPSRSQLRDETARAALSPLAPGERPRALLVAVAVTGLSGAGNAIAYAAGAKIGGHHPGAGVLAFSAAAGALSVGMWMRRYLAVLAFEALLALIVLLFSLFLVEAGNIEGAVLCVGVILAGAWLFWKLVRVMGRLDAQRHSSG
jgi:hypothetical protein